MLEIRWHARAGQGAITAAKVIAEAAMEEGKYIQAMPEYGPERSGDGGRAAGSGADLRSSRRGGVHPATGHYRPRGRGDSSW